MAGIRRWAEPAPWAFGRPGKPRSCAPGVIGAIGGQGQGWPEAASGVVVAACLLRSESVLRVDSPGPLRSGPVNSQPITVGIVGAGRTRSGLGPFLARWCERSGMRVGGISGRALARTEVVAAAMADEFGHEILAHDEVPSLAASGVDALIVASPPAAHPEGLRGALDAGIACLCEKPLAAPNQLGAAMALLDAFERRGLLLVENCQWPFVLASFEKLFPGARTRPVQHVAMGLSPSAKGLAMILDSLPHVLSIADALLVDAVEVMVEHAQLRGLEAADTDALLQFGLAADGRRLAVELHLRHVPSQPRPAWLSIDGHRMDRRIGADYSIGFAGTAPGAATRVVAGDDPLALLVDDFRRRLDRARAGSLPDQGHGRRLRRRWSWYSDILARLGLASGPGGPSNG